MAAIPYARPAYDNRAYTASMADLIRARGAVAANAARQEGSANAYMWGNIIRTAGDTMGDLIKYQAGAPQRELQKQELEFKKNQYNKLKQEDDINVLTKGQSVEERAEVASQIGRPDLAAKYFEQDMDLEKKRLELDAFRADTKSRALKRTGELLQDILLTPKEQRQPKWTAGIGMYTKAMDLMPEDLAGQGIPTTVPDDATIKSYLDQTKTVSERLAAAAQSAENLRKDNAALPEMTKFLADRVALSTPETFGQIKEFATSRGLGPLFVGTFGDTYSPKAIADAKALSAGKGDSEPALGTLADIIKTKESEIGRKLTSAEKAREQAAYEARGRAPEKGETPFKDNPKYPQGVDRYLTDLKNRGYTRDEASAELARTMPKLMADHPNLSGMEVQRALNTYWPISDDTDPVNPNLKGKPLSAPEQARAKAEAEAAAAALKSKQTTGAVAPPTLPPARARLTGTPPRYGPPMTQARATQILTAKLSRPPLPEEIQRFIAKYPYEYLQQ